MSLVSIGTRPSDRWPERIRKFLNPADRSVYGLRIDRATKLATIAAIVLTLAIVAANWFVFLSSRGYVDYVEGLVLFHQTQAAAGENIFDAKFREAPPYSLPMYGPVFYYLIAPAVALWPSLIFGRLVSLASLVILSGLAWKVLRKRFDATILTACVGSVAWLALVGPVFFGVNNRVDSLSVCLGVSAIFAAYSTRPRVWLWCIPLLLLAGFTRATAAVAPGAAIFAVFLLDKRFKEALWLSGTVIASAAFLLILGDRLSHGNFTQCMIFSNGSVAIKAAYFKATAGGAFKQLLLPAGGIAALFLLKDRATRLFGLQAVLSYAVALATAGKMGSHFNYFIEPSWAGCLALALATTKIRRPIMVRLCAAATCVLLVQSALRALPHVKYFNTQMKQYAGIENLVRKYGDRGPILTMESGAQIFAGQSIYVADMHIFTRLNEVGKFDLAPIVDDLRKQKLAAVIARSDIEPDQTGHTNWTPELRRTVASYYRPAEEYAGITVYVPRATPVPESELTATGLRHMLVQTTSYVNGEKATEVTIIDGLKEGAEREWDEQGRLLRETNYVRGKKTGKEILWFENGTMASSTPYKDGEIDGEVTSWYPDGNKWTEAYFVQGFDRGHAARWDDKGRLIDDSSRNWLARRPPSNVQTPQSPISHDIDGIYRR